VEVIIQISIFFLFELYSKTDIEQLEQDF